MDAYKEIAEINSLASEKEFRDNIEDAYGKLPEETDNLINIAVVKMLAMKLGVKTVTVHKADVRLTFNDFKAFANDKLRGAIDGFSDTVRISMATEPALEFVLRGEGNATMLKTVREFLIQAV